MEMQMDGASGLDLQSGFDVAARVRAIIAANALVPVDQVQRDHRLADLGLDSLGVVEVIFGLEEAFDISVPFNANEPGQGGVDLSTVGAVIDAVQALVDR